MVQHSQSCEMAAATKPYSGTDGLNYFSDDLGECELFVFEKKSRNGIIELESETNNNSQN